MNFKEWLTLAEVAVRNRLPADAVTDRGNAYGIPFGSSRTQTYGAAALTGLGGGIGLGVRRAQDRAGVVIRPSPPSEEFPSMPSKKISEGISLPLQLPALGRDENNHPQYSITSTSWNAVNNLTHDPENDPRVRKVGQQLKEEDGKFIPPASGNQQELNFAISFTKSLIHIMTVQKMHDTDPDALKKYDFVNAHTEMEHVDGNNILTCVFSFKRRDNVPDGIKRQNEQN